MKRTLTILPIILTSAALAADSGTNFYGTCVVRMSGHPAYHTTCHLWDTEDDAYYNNWHISVDYVPFAMNSRPRYADWLRTEALAGGVLRWNSILTGSIEITPYDSTVRNDTNMKAGGMESRAQNIVMTVNDDHSFQLDFDEPKSDDMDNTGQVPSMEWLIRNIGSHVMYGKGL